MADYEVIAQGTLTTSTSTSINITSIPATFSHLELFINNRSTKAANTTDGGEINVNGNTSSVYGTIGLYFFNSGSTGLLNQNVNSRTKLDNPFRIMNDNMPANQYAATRFVIPNYSNTSVTRKGFLIQSSTASTRNSEYWHFVAMGNITTSAAINRIEMFAESASYPFKAGTSYFLAGWR